MESYRQAEEADKDHALTPTDCAEFVFVLAVNASAFCNASINFQFFIRTSWRNTNTWQLVKDSGKARRMQMQRAGRTTA